MDAMAPVVANPSVVADRPVAADRPVGVVDGFRQWLATVEVGELTDRERVDLVAALERVKGAAGAAQALATDALRCSREQVARQDVARSVNRPGSGGGIDPTKG
jgi:hypothetical protein